MDREKHEALNAAAQRQPVGIVVVADDPGALVSAAVKEANRHYETRCKTIASPAIRAPGSVRAIVKAVRLIEFVSLPSRAR